MTDEMLDLARAQRSARPASRTSSSCKGDDRGDPAARRLGRRGHLQLRDQPLGRQAAVLREAARVLRPGGRLRVHRRGRRPGHGRGHAADMQQWTGCIAGALTAADFEAELAAAGLVDDRDPARPTACTSTPARRSSARRSPNREREPGGLDPGGRLGRHGAPPAGRDGGQRRRAGDRPRPRRLLLGAPVGHRRLRADPGRRPPHGRVALGPVRPPAGVRLGPGGVHRRLAALRGGRVAGRARRGPRPPGNRRRRPSSRPGWRSSPTSSPRTGAASRSAFGER